MTYRNMAGPFPPDVPLLAKRQDGSTILISINPMEGLTELQDRIARHEVQSQSTFVSTPPNSFQEVLSIQAVRPVL